MARGSDFLGPYRLVKLIRSGQSSQVWEAIKDPDPKRIAVKVLLESRIKEKTDIEQLKHEAEVGKELDDENVIQIFEYNGSFKRPFVAMQLFNARNLKQAIRETPEFLAYHLQDITKQCVKGLAYLHAKGWIHCDIKPDNYLVNDKVVVKLIDFSIAQKSKKSAGLAGLLGIRTKKIQGTRSYMAPEQIRGKLITEKSDIYSLGCMLYELYSGKPPFSADNPDDLLMKHLRSPIPAVQAQNNAISVDMSDYLQKLMAKSPDDRPSSVGDILTKLETLRVYRSGMRPKSAEKSSSDEN